MDYSDISCYGGHALQLRKRNEKKNQLTANVLYQSLVDPGGAASDGSPSELRGIQAPLAKVGNSAAIPICRSIRLLYRSCVTLGDITPVTIPGSATVNGIET